LYYVASAFPRLSWVERLGPCVDFRLWCVWVWQWGWTEVMPLRRELAFCWWRSSSKEESCLWRSWWSSKVPLQRINERYWMIWLADLMGSLRRVSCERQNHERQRGVVWWVALIYMVLLSTANLAYIFLQCKWLPFYSSGGKGGPREWVIHDEAAPDPGRIADATQ